MTKLALLLLSVTIPVCAQFELVLPDGTPVPPVYDLGPVAAGQTAVAHFRLRNLSASSATLTTLNVAGVGFTLTAPPLPIGLAPQAAVDLTVAFSAPDIGTYSAAMHAGGITILLTAAVLPSLTYRTDTPNGLAPLTALDFGAVVLGASAQRRVTLRNETSSILTVPPISVQGAAFSLAAPPPSGQFFLPQQSGEFLVAFTPQAAGASSGTLRIGDFIFPLSAAGIDPPLPKPILSLDLPSPDSARQGTLIVHFDAPAQSAGTGTATLDFRGPSDPTIAFASGSRTAAFAISPGDTQAVLPFQTGTTAGTLTFAAQIGQSSDREDVVIPPAPPTVAAAQAQHSSNTLEILVTAFDNTRTLGALTFLFYDRAGNTISAIPIDAAATFANFFAASDLGGVFLLHAVFPVTGDPSQVAACDVTLTNSVSTATRHILLP